MPGESIAVTAPLPEKIGTIGELTYHTDAEDLRVVFDSLQSGYWLGGRMWRGRIVVGPEARPGLHETIVAAREGVQMKPPYTAHVEVFRDALSLRKASPSYILRYLGASPWAAALFFAPLFLLAFGAVFLLSRKAARLLAREGKAEVYDVAEGEKGCEIYFGLGLSQGIRPGDAMAIFDEKERPTGTAIVQEVFREHSTALAGSESLVKPGFMVSRSRMGPSIS